MNNSHSFPSPSNLIHQGSSGEGVLSLLQFVDYFQRAMQSSEKKQILDAMVQFGHAHEQLGFELVIATRHFSNALINGRFPTENLKWYCLRIFHERLELSSMLHEQFPKFVERFNAISTNITNLLTKIDQAKEEYSLLVDNYDTLVSLIVAILETSTCMLNVQSLIDLQHIVCCSALKLSRADPHITSTSAISILRLLIALLENNHDSVPLPLQIGHSVFFIDYPEFHRDPRFRALICRGRSICSYASRPKFPANWPFPEEAFLYSQPTAPIRKEREVGITDQNHNNNTKEKQKHQKPSEIVVGAKKMKTFYTSPTTLPQISQNSSTLQQPVVVTTQNQWQNQQHHLLPQSQNSIPTVPYHISFGEGLNSGGKRRHGHFVQQQSLPYHRNVTEYHQQQQNPKATSNRNLPKKSDLWPKIDLLVDRPYMNMNNDDDGIQGAKQNETTILTQQVFTSAEKEGVIAQQLEPVSDEHGNKDEDDDDEMDFYQMLAEFDSSDEGEEKDTVENGEMVEHKKDDDGKRNEEGTKTNIKHILPTDDSIIMLLSDDE